MILEPQSPSKSYGRPENQDLISYRIFDVDAIHAPGVLYKSVIVHPDMDSLSVRSLTLVRTRCSFTALLGGYARYVREGLSGLNLEKKKKRSIY